MSAPESLSTGLVVEECFVPHVGWMSYEAGDAVLRGLREGDFEYVEQAALLRLLRPGDVFVDGGAHAGLYSRLAALCVGSTGKIVAVEPTPSTQKLLQLNTRLIDPNVVTLVLSALARDDGEADLATGGPGQSAYNRVLTTEEKAGGMRVKCQSLPSLLRELNLTRVDVLKLDVEGSEIEILQGAHSLLERGAIGILLIEFNEENLHRSGGSCAQLAALLNEHGYRLFSIDQDRFDLVAASVIGGERYTNYLATRNEAALRQRFSHPPATAARAASDILRRGAAVAHQKNGALAALSEQRAYIESLETEKRRLEAELAEARDAGARLGADCARILAEHEATAKTAQAHIDRQLKERQQARLAAQKHIDQLLSDGRHYAEVIEQQNALIASLQRECERLRADGPPPSSST